MNYFVKYCCFLVLVTVLALSGWVSSYDSQQESSLPPALHGSAKDILTSYGLSTDDEYNETPTVYRRKSELAVAETEQDAAVTSDPLELVFAHNIWSFGGIFRTAVFSVLLFSTWSLCLLSLEAQRVSVYQCANGGIQLFFGGLGLYDVLRGFSVAYIGHNSYSKLLVVLLVLTRSSLLLSYGFRLLSFSDLPQTYIPGLNLMYQRYLPQDLATLSYVTAALTLVYAFFLTTNSTFSNNTPYYAMAYFPVAANIFLSALEDPKAHRIIDDLVATIEVSGSYSRIAFSGCVGALWLVFVLELTPLRLWLPLFHATWFQTAWLGFVTLYGLPWLCLHRLSPPSYQKFAALYFSTPVLTLVTNYLRGPAERLGRHRNKVILGAAVCLTALPFANMLRPVLWLLMSPIPVPIQEWINQEFYFVIQAADFFIQNSTLSLLFSYCIYLLIGAYIYDRIYEQPHMYTLWRLWGLIWSGVGSLKDGWSTMVEAAAKEESKL